MIKVRFAAIEDAQAISDICSQAWKKAYAQLYSNEYISKVIDDFYNVERITEECKESSKDWYGYIVAYDGNDILGCIGGTCDNEVGFIYVLYVKPDLKGIGIGSALLDFLTEYQIENYLISRQEVYVTTGNTRGIPFYLKHGFKLQEVIPNWIDENEGTKNKYSRLV
ncbi:GNAT family N-acetyltransferase [Streptococcus ictaluri]|uniref:FR47-like protein n=1 Tax=Streptococcus ictaluri 707-05 TaxID=764299 RepID=G5K4S9_9STRE|nr:GNAT family N-acetyltransferase [Streptococcus ictaluri]EHI69065.1 FR47-like protein [Streptococcus ictaluri 707-05]